MHLRPIAAAAIVALLSDFAHAAPRPLTSSTRSRATSAVAGGALDAQPSTKTALTALDALPMRFEENVGQTDERVRYLARGRGYTVFVTDAETVLALTTPSAHAGGMRPGAAKRDEIEGTEPTTQSSAVRMTWPGAATHPRVVAERPLEGATNYFVGERDAWRTSVQSYERVRVEGIYEGIDAVLYGNGESLEYDFEVKPGADAGRIRIKFEGAEKMHVDERGEVVMQLEGGELRQLAAEVYQQGAAAKERVEARYELAGDGEVSLALGEYDRTRPLTIDPVIIFADYLGGSLGRDYVTSLALDPTGATVVAGFTTSPNFPATAGTFDPIYNGGDDAFVAKVNAAGTGLVFATYFGFVSDDIANGVAVDASGGIYACGTYLGTVSGLDAFVLKLTPSGSLVYLKTVGGGLSDFGEAIAVDGAGSAYLSGQTGSSQASGFPITAGAFDTTLNAGFSDAYVAKLSPSGDSIVYATYLGGPASEETRAITVDGAGVVTVVGRTSSATEFPITTGAYDTTFDGETYDGYVTRLDATGSSLVFSTYIGGSSDESVEGVAIDATGATYIAGTTDSQDFPTTPGAYQSPPNELKDAFAAKLAPDGGSLVYGARIGGAENDVVSALAVDTAGAAYLVGTTDSADFPTTAGALDTTANGSSDGFLTKLSPTGTQLDLSTYVGGNQDDSAAGVAVRNGEIYVVGKSASGNFPATYATPSGRPDGSDVFVVKITNDGADLAYSLAFGGDAGTPAIDSANTVAVDASGAVYVAGKTASLNFPTTLGSVAFDSGGKNEAFVVKLAPGGGSLVYATFLGGSGNDDARAIAVDASGAPYVTGATGSSDFPKTAGAFATASAGGFVTKLAPSGASLVYSGVLCTGSAGEAIAVDGGGAAYVAGTVLDASLPVTAWTYDATWNGNADGFAIEVVPSGTGLVYATYLGGSSADHVYAIAIEEGTATVAGDTFSPDFPVTPGAFDSSQNGNSDAFVTRLSVSGTSLLFSTFLGGSSAEIVRAIAIDSARAIYVAGTTVSSDFPTTAGAYDTTANGQDGFVTKLSSAGSALVYSTYLGGTNDDSCVGVVIGADGSATVAGSTGSPNFPVTPGAFDTSYNGSTDAFVARLSPTGSTLAYASYFGTPTFDNATGAAGGPSGAVYVAGVSGPLDFATGGFGWNDESTAFVFALAPVADTAAIYAPATGAWFVRYSNTSGGANNVFTFGAGGAGLRPLAGDWNGDGLATPGLYDAATGAFFLRNSASPGPADLVFTFGAGGAGFVPLVGDWDGDGTDTIGLYAPATGAFFLKNTNANGGADLVFTFGGASATAQPIAGDWNGDGIDTIGLYERATGAFFLRNASSPGPADLTFVFGGGGAETTAVTGDFDGDATDTVGIYTTAGSVFFLRNANAPGGADLTFSYGAGGVPVVGAWAG